MLIAYLLTIHVHERYDVHMSVYLQLEIKRITQFGTGITQGTRTDWFNFGFG